MQLAYDTLAQFARRMRMGHQRPIGTGRPAASPRRSPQSVQLVLIARMIEAPDFSIVTIVQHLVQRHGAPTVFGGDLHCGMVHLEGARPIWVKPREARNNFVQIYVGEARTDHRTVNV